LAEGRELLAMLAARSEPASLRTDAHLVEMLARATRELREREAAGQRSDAVRAVIRSVRKTLSRMAERGTVPDPDASDFWVQCSSDEEIELWHRGKRLPIRARYFESAFESAGVVLEPGEWILADPELVRGGVEDSLLACALQELRLREMKAELFRVADELNVAATPVGRAG
jgi:hypothetical protein